MSEQTDDRRAEVGAPKANLNANSLERAGAIELLRRGMAVTPELRDGLLATALMGLAVAVGRLTVPVVIQRALDSGSAVDGSIDTGSVLANTSVALVIIVLAALSGWWAQRRLVLRAETSIANLRIRAFNHVHRLSVADHNETRRGVLVSRVTSDAEALARFANWGLFSWAINPPLIIGIILVLAVYSWQIAIVVVVAYAPVVPVLNLIQKRQIVAYDVFRTRVSDMLAAFSEAVMGAEVIRAYGAEDRSRRILHETIDRRYRARIITNRFMAGVFVVGDLFGAIAVALVLGLGLWQRQAWGLEPGVLVACVFLATLLNGPIADLAESMDQTQTAAAAWRKILVLLDRAIDVIEPEDGLALPAGPVAISAHDVDFAYRDSELVLDGINVEIEAGTKVAVVGETGSGKTTFAKLLCRLADPTAGKILLSGVDLTTVAPQSRMQSVRMVPQDGFLFDASIRTNVGFGHQETSDDVVVAAFEALDLGWWLAQLGDGLDTEVGERGENLSVGERQLVALARAQLADPGLLVLDEATSAVDPEIDQALTQALRRLAEGRTLVSVAHRLATAEAADLVLVFDHGRLVEQGSHSELLADGGVYQELHRAWVGNTRTSGSD